MLDGIRAAVSPETEVLYERGCNFLGQALHPFDPSMLRDENGEAGLTERVMSHRCPTRRYGMAPLPSNRTRVGTLIPR